MAVTLQQIADACDVSRGTVDRALHGKPGIRPEVAQRVRETAQKLGYIPSRSCPVVTKRTVRIGVVLHSASAEFVKILAGHLRSYPSRELLPLEPIVRMMEGVDIGHQLALIDELVEQEHVDGLAIMPLANEQIAQKIHDLSRLGIPVVTLNTDINDSSRLAYVGPDLFASGRAAAALMGLATGGHGAILPIIGQESGHYADSQRMLGFLEEMETNFPNITVIPAISCYRDSDMAERITLRVLEENPHLAGIYVSSVGRSGVYRAVERAGRIGQVHLVVHDLTEDNLRMIRRGVVDFAVGQDVKTQGTLPLRMLYQYLTKHVEPQRRIYITDIEVKFRCNLNNLDVYSP